MKKRKGISLFRLLIILIFILAIFSLLSSIFINKKNDALEDKLINQAKKYLNTIQNNFDNYFLSKFTEYLLPVEELNISNDLNGYVKITKDSKYHFEYIKYKGNSLYSEILKNNNITNEDDGLYINEYENNNLYDLKYIFKGENVNNYIKINSTLYRIIGITNSYNLKVIRSDYNTDINFYGLGGNINFLIEDDDLKTVNKLNYSSSKYFSLGMYNVGFIPEDDEVLIDIIKSERKNLSITKKVPNYIGYAGLINVSDVIRVSTNDSCNIKKLGSCRSYLYDLLNDGLVTANSTSCDEKNCIYVVTKEGLKKISDVKMSGNKEVVYIKGSIKYLNGDGSINNPYTY